MRDLSGPQEFFKNVRLGLDGLWRTETKNNVPVSYPQGDHETCFSLEDDSPWFEHRNKVITKIAKRYSAHRDFLDVGGGNGAVAKHLAQDGYRPIVIEPGEQGARNALARGLKIVICAELSDLKANAPIQADFGLFDVVEHIDDDMTFLKSLASMMSETSSLIITVPAFQSLWSERDVEAGHFRRYTISHINGVLRQSGLEPIYSTYFFMTLAPLMLLANLLLRSRRQKKKHVQKDHAAQHRYVGLLRLFFSLERQLLSVIRMPIGASIVVVARKSSKSE